jgi:hypothetical protein
VSSFLFSLSFDCSALLQLLEAMPLPEQLLASLLQFSADRFSMAINDDFPVTTHSLNQPLLRKHP